MRTLNVKSGPAAGQTRAIDEEIIIGRESADFTIPDQELSRRHALVRPVADGVVIQDLGSLNGTFVNGERISRPVTLTSSGTISLGTSEIAVELDVAGATVMSTQRVIRPEQETIPAGAEARAGYVRQVAAEEPPPPAPTAVPVSGARPSTSRPHPTPRTAAPTPPSPTGRPGWLKWALPFGGLAAVAAVAAALVFVLGGDDETKVRKLTSNLTTALLKQTATRVTFGGTTNQTPGGQGLVVGNLRLKGDLTKGKPVPLTATMVFRFEGGRLNATVKGNAIPQPNKTTNLVGTGKITGGTGEFEGATGSFSFKSGQEAANPTIGHPKIRGTIKY